VKDALLPLLALGVKGIKFLLDGSSNVVIIVTSLRSFRLLLDAIQLLGILTNNSQTYARVMTVRNSEKRNRHHQKKPQIY